MIKAFVPIALLSFLAAAPASAVPAAPAPVTLGGAHVGDVVQVQNRQVRKRAFATPLSRWRPLPERAARLAPLWSPSVRLADARMRHRRPDLVLPITHKV